MAVLIDSLANLDHSIRRKFKKVFTQLDDNYLVRTAMLNESKVADIVVEGPCKSWLLIGCHESSPASSELVQYLAFNKALKSLGYSNIKYLAITEVGESLFDVKDAALVDVDSVERDAFFETGHDKIFEMLTETEAPQYDWIKAELFSETNIKVECTTRRQPIKRDSSAKLQLFFLDYDQEMATKLDMFDEERATEEVASDDFSVRLINGVAGCGKTLILINRAILYCKKYPDRKTLLLIHNKPVTADVEYKFEEYLGGKPENLTIKTFHSFSLGQQKKVANATRPLFGEKALKPLKETVSRNADDHHKDLRLSDDQIWSELEYINEYLIEDKEAYFAFDRQGRGFTLKRAQRESIWQLYIVLMGCLPCDNRGYLPSLYIKELCLSNQVDDKLDKYHHILVDEAQFFFPSWLQLVKKSLRENGQLFMCADPNQGFLKSRMSWKSVGLNVVGRTKKLNYSYRTTYEIMALANALLESVNDSAEDFVKPNLSNMVRGSKPQVIYSLTPQDEQKRFINELKSCVESGDVPLDQMMVLCSDKMSSWGLKRTIAAALGYKSVVNCNDRNDLDNNLGSRIRVMSINSCTGMESGVTFVLGVGDLLNAANNIELSEDEREVIKQESTRKLYVAMTRAGQKLVLLSTERLPDRVAGYVDELGCVDA